jgi:hypothetical protein
MHETDPSGFGEFDEQTPSNGEQPFVSEDPEFDFGDGYPEESDTSGISETADHPSMRAIEDTPDSGMTAPDVLDVDALGTAVEPITVNDVVDADDGLQPNGPEESPNTESGSGLNTERQRDMLSKALINPASCTRFVVGVEDTRVDELLGEQPSKSDTGESRLAGFGRSLLERAGLRDPRTPRQEEPLYLDNRQKIHGEFIAQELSQSRELIRGSVIEGVDDVDVDRHLGLRTDDCMLPPLFQELHRRAEAETGDEVTFLKWMTDHATDEQLLNVWQWHDHYLSRLDNDPAFQERVSSIKAGYAEGSGLAIEAGALHPDLSVQEPTMSIIDVVHGSPFSPILAAANAYADKTSGVVQMREGAGDYTLYHEVTHLLTGGVNFEFDEGITDLVTAEVYNRVHPEQERVDPRGSVYADQIVTLDALNRMSGGRVGLRELSRVYAGPDGFQNTLGFIARIDEVVGLPVTLPLLKSARELFARNAGIYGGGAVRSAVQLHMRQQAEFLADMMFDSEGNKVAGTIPELLARIVSEDTAAKYSQGRIAGGLKILFETSELQELMPHIRLPEPGAEEA